jgi:hypothetical protein
MNIPPDIDRCTTWLRALLAAGPKNPVDVHLAAHAAGFTPEDVAAARRQLRLRDVRHGGVLTDRGTFRFGLGWALPRSTRRRTRAMASRRLFVVHEPDPGDARTPESIRAEAWAMRYGRRAAPRPQGAQSTSSPTESRR